MGGWRRSVTFLRWCQPSPLLCVGCKNTAHSASRTEKRLWILPHPHICYTFFVVCRCSLTPRCHIHTTSSESFSTCNIIVHFLYFYAEYCIHMSNYTGPAQLAGLAPNMLCMLLVREYFDQQLRMRLLDSTPYLLGRAACHTSAASSYLVISTSTLSICL